MTYLNLSFSCFESKNLIWEKKGMSCGDVPDIPPSAINRRMRKFFVKNKGRGLKSNHTWEKKPALCPVTGPFWRAGADTDAGAAGLILFISCSAAVSCKGGIS
jgi:hypothetical protein